LREATVSAEIAKNGNVLDGDVKVLMLYDEAGPEHCCVEDGVQGLKGE